MPLPFQAGETALGFWRLRCTLLTPTLVDDGAGGQTVEWTPGTSFAAVEGTTASAEAMGMGLRTQVLRTVETWFRRDLKSDTDLGVNARLHVTDGVTATLYEMAGPPREVAGPGGERLRIALDLIGLAADEPMPMPEAARRGAARYE